MNRRRFIAHTLSTAAAAPLLARAATALPATAAADAHAVCRRLGRGINLGNGFEAPSEGAWGYTVEASNFARIKEAGFDSVRIPIRWSTRAAEQKPFTVKPQFMDRIAWALDQAQANDLAAVINHHHYEEVFRDPDGHADRFNAIWDQVATAFRDRPDTVVFELLNEPHDTLTPELWNAFFTKTLATVRQTNPNRAVMIGPGGWNNVNELEKLVLPESDRNLIATFHYYLPFNFTHQGAGWVGRQSEQWLGTTWTGSTEEQAALDKDFGLAAQYAKKYDRPIYVGEFGAYSKADMDSRARWTRAVVQTALKHDFAYAYWEFASGFGAFDPERGEWREPLLKALMAAV